MPTDTKARGPKLDEATCRRICEELNIDADRLRRCSAWVIGGEVHPWRPASAPCWFIVQRAAGGSKK